MRQRRLRRWVPGLAFAAGCLAVVLALAGCNGDGGQDGKKWTRGPVVVDRQHPGGYPIKVVCTTGMAADLVRTIGGNHVAVTALMGADVDPHTYKAATGDVAQLSGADVIFYSGLHLEGKMTDV